jgi:hypothetical protein
MATLQAELKGALRESVDIENERHFAIAHDRGAGEGGDALELFAERLDDDFLGVVDLVDHKPE